MEIIGKKTPASLDTYIKNIDKAKKLNQASQKPDNPGEKEGDTVALSAQAKQIQAASQLVKSMPDVREELVASIRQQIETGTYRIDAGEIAAAMLKEVLSDENS